MLCRRVRSPQPSQKRVQRGRGAGGKEAGRDKDSQRPRWKMLFLPEPNGTARLFIDSSAVAQIASAHAWPG